MSDGLQLKTLSCVGGMSNRRLQFFTTTRADKYMQTNPEHQMMRECPVQTEEDMIR